MSTRVRCDGSRPMRAFSGPIWAGLTLVLAACGGNVTRVQSIEAQTGVFPANENFRVRVLLVCPASCFEYDLEDAECDVEVDEEAREVTFRPSLPIDDTGDGCFESGCPGLTGLPVFCAVPPLDPGDWTFRAGEGANQISESVELL